MITLQLGGTEHYSYETEEFISSPVRDVTFNHCLKAIAKWESRYCTPFLEKKSLTNEEAMYYFNCMANKPITKLDITNHVMNALNNYVTANVTATTFRDDPNAPKQKKQIITSEVLYGQMVVGNIPFECEEWHIQRLMTLLRVVGDLQTPEKDKKKMSKKDIASQNRDLNAQRRAAMASKG
jgi:hypothetical protein